VRLQSRLFISPSAQYSAGYRRVLYTHFNAEVQQANFSFPVEAAAVINSWACNATDDKVKQIVTNGMQYPTVLGHTFFFNFWDEFLM
jgi:serine protease inhibitor